MPYLNSAVFYRYLPAGPWELTDMPPRAMASAVELGELQAGPLPVVEVFRLGDTLQPIGGLGVAATGPATSVLLFSRRPVERLAGGRVGLTSESATSVQLIRILFRDWWRVEPAEYVETDEPNDALLLIGDKALRARQRLSGYPVRIRPRGGVVQTYRLAIRIRDVGGTRRFTTRLDRRLPGSARDGVEARPVEGRRNSGRNCLVRPKRSSGGVLHTPLHVPAWRRRDPRNRRISGKAKIAPPGIAATKLASRL